MATYFIVLNVTLTDQDQFFITNPFSIQYPHFYCCYILFKICILPFDIELFLTPNSQCFVIMVSRCSMLQEAKPFAVMCATLLIMVPLVLLSLWSFTTCFCLRMFCTFLCLSKQSSCLHFSYTWCWLFSLSLVLYRSLHYSFHDSVAFLVIIARPRYLVFVLE